MPVNTPEESSIYFLPAHSPNPICGTLAKQYLQILFLGNDRDFPIISSQTQTFYSDSTCMPSYQKKKREREKACCRDVLPLAPSPAPQRRAQSPGADMQGSRGPVQCVCSSPLAAPISRAQTASAKAKHPALCKHTRPD